MKKISSKTMIGILSGIVLGITLAGYAANITSAQVSYSHTKTSKTNAKDALDELIPLAKNCTPGCPEGYTCTKKITCKRIGHSSELHTETCNQKSAYCGATRGKGNTITYGNVGTKGTLTVGDAFDCDVIGDGSYMVNGEAARFYYVSTMAGHRDVTDSNYAVLVYYTNVVNGHNNNTSGVAWASSGSNSSGPVTAKTHLPGNAPVSWPGVSLKSSTRRISDEGGTPVVDFDYGSAQARFLTYQEIYNGCYDGSTAITLKNALYSKCEFLLENTRYADSSRETYGPWLETTHSSKTGYGWRVNSTQRYVFGCSVNNTGTGVRPAIEVPLSDIDY